MVMRATTPNLNLNSCGFTIPFGMGMTLGFRLIKPKFLIQHIRTTGSMTSLDEMAYDLMVTRRALAEQSATTSALIIAVALGLKAIITKLSITLPSKTQTMMYVWAEISFMVGLRVVIALQLIRCKEMANGIVIYTWAIRMLFALPEILIQPFTTMLGIKTLKS